MTTVWKLRAWRMKFSSLHFESIVRRTECVTIIRCGEENNTKFKSYLHINRMGSWSVMTLDLCWWRLWFESPPALRLAWTTGFVIFFSHYRKLAEWYLKPLLLSNSFQFIIHRSSYPRCCIVWDTKSQNTPPSPLPKQVNMWIPRNLHFAYIVSSHLTRQLQIKLFHLT
jgi:hypothetical protein